MQGFAREDFSLRAVAETKQFFTIKSQFLKQVTHSRSFFYVEVGTLKYHPAPFVNRNNDENTRKVVPF